LHNKERKENVLMFLVVMKSPVMLQGRENWMLAGGQLRRIGTSENSSRILDEQKQQSYENGNISKTY
jgi:hypothetical protein